jgi:hypothetical protein
MPNSAVTEFLRSIAYDDYIMEQLVRYAADRGYEFTVSDLKNQLSNVLRDAQLGSLAGIEPLPPTMLNT